MISAHPITLPFLGRRWRAHCHRCRIDLPGRYSTVDQATDAGNNHATRWHPAKKKGKA
jgi:hypothetical protein